MTTRDEYNQYTEIAENIGASYNDVNRFSGADYGALDRYYGDQVRQAQGEIDSIRAGDTAAQRQVLQQQKQARTQMGNAAASGGASPMLARSAQMRGDEGQMQAYQQRNMVQANELGAANQAMLAAQQQGSKYGMHGLGLESGAYAAWQGYSSQDAINRANAYAARTSGDSAQTTGIIGGFAGAGTAGLGAGSGDDGQSSDERAKKRAYMSGVKSGVRFATGSSVGNSDQALAKYLPRELRKSIPDPRGDAYPSAATSPFSDNPRALSLQEELGREGASKELRNLASRYAADNPRPKSRDDRPMLVMDARKNTQDYMSAIDEANLDALRKLEPDAYVYREGVPDDSGGRVQYGPMAQDLEKSPVGASVVYDTPQGKMVDTKAATMQQYGMLTALAKRQDRIDRMLAGQDAGGAMGGK